MKKISISFLIPILLCSTYLNAQTGTIVANRAIVFQNKGKGKKLGTMRFALPVRVLSQTKRYILVVRGRLKGWVSSRNIVLTPSPFANIGEAALLAPQIPLSGKNAFLYYYFKKRIFKYSVIERKNKSSQNIGLISQILANNNREKFLVEGVHTNRSDIHSLGLFDYNNAHIQLLGSFVKKSVIVADSSFSPDNKYIAVSFKIGSKMAAVLYSAENGRYIGTALNTDGITWTDYGPVFHNKRNFWLIRFSNLTNENLDFNKKRLLFKTVKLHGTRHLAIRFYNGRLYVKAGGRVKYYDFQQNKLIGSRLKTVDFDNNFKLQHLKSGLVTINGGKRYSRFGGARPRYRFESFIGNFVLYRRQKNKLSSYFLAPINDPYSDKAYQYKAIDEINAQSDNGILAQIATDGDKSIIWVENPHTARFEIIRLW